MRFIKKVISLCRSMLWFKGMFHGIAATVELEKLLKDIRIPETIIDVGSNKGQFILLIEKLFPNKKIYSFEPITEILNKQKKFFKYKKNIFFYNLALGSSIKSEDFFITNRMDSSSFLKIAKLENNSKDYLIKEKRSIQISTLDDILNNENITGPILLKMDVQGYELEVLKGSSNMLSKIDYLLLEVSKNEMYQNQPREKNIIDYLKNLNFTIYKTNHWHNIKNTDFKQRDILFCKEL